MARKARVVSKSGIYHIMLKGNGKALFKDNEDKNMFLNLISSLCDNYLCDIYAYCLLDADCSILVKAGKNLSLLMKSLQIRYASYYNNRYEEKGRLFKDRFKSISVETDEEFAENLRYIHQLPELLGVVDNFREFEYSSFDEYTDEQLICDISYIEKIRGFDFTGYHNVKSSIKVKKRTLIDDEKAKDIVFEITGNKDIMNLPERDELLVKLKENGLSIRQIERLTGINRGTVYNARITEKTKEPEIFLL